MSEQSNSQSALPSALGAFKDVFKFYEDGKGRRYGLLFAVNGGALAIVKGIGEAATISAAAIGAKADSAAAATFKQEAAQSFGFASIGMIVFVLIMTVDIWKFGGLMRAEALKFRIAGAPVPFGPVGKAVLVLNAALLVTAWAFAARI